MYIYIYSIHIYTYIHRYSDIDTAADRPGYSAWRRPRGLGLGCLCGSIRGGDSRARYMPVSRCRSMIYLYYIYMMIYIYMYTIYVYVYIVIVIYLYSIYTYIYIPFSIVFEIYITI